MALSVTVHWPVDEKLLKPLVALSVCVNVYFPSLLRISWPRTVKPDDTANGKGAPSTLASVYEPVIPVRLASDVMWHEADKTSAANTEQTTTLMRTLG